MLCTQSFVVDGGEHLIQSGLVVARVVFKTECAGVGELFFLDEVLGADLGLVHAQLLCQDINHAFNQVHRLSHAEAAAIGDATGRLVGVHTLDARVCGRDIVGARANVEQASRKLGWVSTGIKCAVIGDHVDPQSQDFAVLRCRQLTIHVVVTRKCGAGDIFDAVFHPLYGATQHDGRHDGADVAGINANFVAEATTDIWANDPYF